jgi:transcriptional regulator with XRE-family HTH domain
MSVTTIATAHPQQLLGVGDHPTADSHGATRHEMRRGELAAFLRNRRERLQPEDVGLPPGIRRRTPGLRREEVAQLAGVGVTWYTWLEQGRPINASLSVLEAIASTLRLDDAEREHLFRLAGLAISAETSTKPCVPEQFRRVLGSITDLPASISSSMYDVLAWNEFYARLFPGMVRADRPRRNVLWACFVAPACCNPFIDRDAELPMLVARLRAAYARHVGEPAWETFLRDLRERSPEFARMWAMHDVSSAGPSTKVFRHLGVGEIRMISTVFHPAELPETRLSVYLPVDDESRERLELLRAGLGGDVRCGKCGTEFGGAG